MRKPKIKEFYNESSDDYDFDEYEEVMGDYEDSERDREIEEKFEREEENNVPHRESK